MIMTHRYILMMFTTNCQQATKESMPAMAEDCFVQRSAHERWIFVG
jgi:hypothetical protein